MPPPGLSAHAGAVDRVVVKTTGHGDRVIDDFKVVPVPEPETYAMMLAGIGMLGALARRRRRV